MKKEEILKLADEIGTCENMEDVRAKLVEFKKSLDKDYTSFETSQEEVKSLKERNDKLTKANMDLYLQVSTPSGKDKDSDKNKNNENEGEEELTYDNLFDEKGGLK